MLAGCSGEYRGMPRVEMLDYQARGTYGSLYSLAVAHGRAINEAVKADTLHPGMYAEYGVALALMGHRDAACRMLNAEMKTFPESRGMVMRVKQRLMPDLLGDTLARVRDTANLVQLAAWAYDSVAAMIPLPYTAPVIDSTDTAWLRQQTPVDSVVVPVRLTANQKRELLAQQQAEEAAAKQAVLDSIAAAKQAKLNARKAAKEERKALQKAKKKAQADAKKERDNRNKERQRQREEQKKNKNKSTKKK